MKTTKEKIKKMPESYKGDQIKVKNTIGRQWTVKEFEWVRNMINKNFTDDEIALSIDRTISSAAYGIKIIKKQDNVYNKSHLNEKYDTNMKFIERIEPKSVLDLYCGPKNFYKGKVKNVTSNDKNKLIEATYNMDAHKCICYLYSQNKKYDLIDLDPYGNSYDCFDLAIKMAKKGLIITFGEMYCKRWKNDKFIKRYYNLSLEDFTIDNVIEHVQMIAKRNNKILDPIYIGKWKNINRVWFEIEDMSK